ncbi:hypothetical protein TNCV_85801 [Trichonephila clavipes]|nr:hypothetical protein TNCV_85801 [Trichonephila clavipes]
MASNSKRKRNVLNIETKFEILNRLTKGESGAPLAHVRFRILQKLHSVFGYPNNRISERCPVPIDSDKRRSTVYVEQQGRLKLYSLKNWEFRTTCQLATCDDHRPCLDLGLPPYIIISHSVKRRQSVEPVCAVSQIDTQGILHATQSYDMRAYGIRKIYRLQLGSNPQSWAYEASTLPLSHLSRL